MITAMFFKSPDFEPTDDNNLINPLTDNTIIVCGSRAIMRTISAQIRLANEAGGPDYTTKAGNGLPASIICTLDYNGAIKYLIDDEQRITITTEPSLVLTATDPWDIWFATENSSGLVEIYPFCCFKEHNEQWDAGLEHIHKRIVLGCYGDIV